MPRKYPLIKMLPLFLWLASKLSADTAEEALWSAIEAGNLEAVQTAIAAGAEPAESTRPFLSFAAGKGSLEIVKSLIAARARLETSGQDGPVLFVAANCREGTDQLEIIRQLLSAGVLQATNDGGAGAMRIAITNGRWDIVQLLSTAGARIETSNQSEPSILHEILARSIIDEVKLSEEVRKLLAWGTEPQRKDKQGRNAGDVAAEYGLPDILAILEPGNAFHRDLARVRQTGLDRQLHAAIAAHNSSRIHWANQPPNQPGSQLQTIKAKLKAGANPRVSIRIWSEWERTALGVLLDSSTAPPFNADPEVLELLLANGAQWEDLGKSRNRRLKEVLAMPGLALVAVQHGLRGDAPLPTYSLSARDYGKEIPSTPLHAAAEGGSIPVVEKLLKAGGHLDGIDGAGYTPLARAVTSGREELTEYLIKRGARIDTITTEGLSLVDLAAQANNRPRIQLWDRDGRYRELLEAYAPPKNSRWIGEWMMGDLKFPSKIKLKEDGSGFIDWESNWLMWTETDDGIRIRLAQRNRMGSLGGSAEFDLLADNSGRLSAKKSEYGDHWQLWRPGSPPDPSAKKAQAAIEATRKLEKKIDEQIAALDSKRSDTFWLDSATPPTGLPEKVWKETRWRRFSVQIGEIGTLPSAMSQMDHLQFLEIANQKHLLIEEGALRLPTLERMDFRSAFIETIPLEWNYLPNLKELSIYDGRLEQLPAGWALAKNLIVCRIGRNRLHRLPNDIGDAPLLKTLAVSGNQLSTLPSSLDKSHLEELYLDENRFTQVPSVLRNMTALRALSLTQNRLTAIDVGAFPASLTGLGLGGNRLTRAPDVQTLSHLESLNLSRNGLKEIPDDPAWLPASVKELDLSDNQLDHLPAWLLERPFRRLNLGRNAWTEEWAREISQQAEKRWQAKPKK